MGKKEKIIPLGTRIDRLEEKLFQADKPILVDTYFHLAQLYLRKTNISPDPDTYQYIELILNKCNELDENPIYYNLIGEIHLRQNNLDKAEKAFQKAFDINPVTKPHKWIYQEPLNQDANKSITDQLPKNNHKRCSLLSIFTKLFPKSDNPDKQESPSLNIEPTSPKEQIVFDGQVREKYISAYFLSEIYLKYFSKNKPPIFQNVKKQLSYFNVCKTLDPTDNVYHPIVKDIKF